MRTLERHAAGREVQSGHAEPGGTPLRPLGRFKTVINGRGGWVRYEVVNEPFEPAGPWPCERCCAYVTSADHDCQEAI